MTENIKRHIVSGVVTFIATFLTTVATILVAVPTENLLNPETYTVAFFAGIILTAARHALKVATEKFVVTK